MSYVAGPLLIVKRFTVNMSGVPYLGSRIVLISKSEIRYEGTLYTIDTTNSTVALQNVRSFGTEGRKETGVIPPSSEVFDYIIFRGTDIKDLHVCETVEAPTAAPAVILAPALVPAPAPAPACPVAASSLPPAWGANPSQAASVAVRDPGAAPNASLPLPVLAPHAARSRAQPGSGAHVTTRASRGCRGKNGTGAGEHGEFDFEKMLAGFCKVALEEEASGKMKTSNAYNKNASFFDALDEEVTEAGPRKGRRFLEDMRKASLACPLFLPFARSNISIKINPLAPQIIRPLVAQVDAQTFGEELVKSRGGKGGKGGGKISGRAHGKGGRGGSRGGGSCGPRDVGACLSNGLGRTDNGGKYSVGKGGDRGKGCIRGGKGEAGGRNRRGEIGTRDESCGKRKVSSLPTPLHLYHS